MILPELQAARRAAGLRRSAACCPGPDTVLGLSCRPLTPATFSALHATGSRFIHGGQPMEGCVRNYLWFHSPLFRPAGEPGHARAKARALAPWQRLLHGPWWARPWLRHPHRYSTALALATTDIAAHLEEAFADAPAASGRPGAPLASLEAQLIDLCAREYGWPAETTRHTPLRLLFQLLRCLTAAKGGDLSDPAESAILAAHLRAKNNLTPAA